MKLLDVELIRLALLSAQNDRPTSAIDIRLALAEIERWRHDALEPANWGSGDKWAGP